MSAPDYPAETEARQILSEIGAQAERLERLIEAVNQLGANTQWLVDNVQGVFQMFHSPMFMQMIQGALSGQMPMAEGMILDGGHSAESAAE